MAVQFPKKAWSKEEPLLAKSMEDIEGNPDAFMRFKGLDQAQQEAVKSALPSETVYTFQSVIESARIALPVVALKPAPETPWPQSIVTFQRSDVDFKKWLIEQATLVEKNPGLKFDLGKALELEGDGTITVPICILRQGAATTGTNFVFHYHPGATGASVKSGAHASQGHFKPYDGAPKFIRVTRDDCRDNAILTALWKDGKGRATHL